jgi:hypothetical protein
LDDAPGLPFFDMPTPRQNVTALAVGHLLDARDSIEIALRLLWIAESITGAERAWLCDARAALGIVPAIIAEREFPAEESPR